MKKSPQITKLTAITVFCLISCREIYAVTSNEITSSPGHYLPAVEQKQNGYDVNDDVIVTVIFRQQLWNSEENVSGLLKQAIASALNGEAFTASAIHHPRRRKDGGGKRREYYSPEDVRIVEIDPDRKSVCLRIPVPPPVQNGLNSSRRDVIEAITAAHWSITKQVERPLRFVFESSQPKRRQAREAATPATTTTTTNDTAATTTTTTTNGGSTIWDAHFWLFIAIIIFIGISILLTITCCICLRCRSKATPGPKDDPLKEDPVISSTTGLMQEQSPSNEPPTLDEENGWIIPLDQMTKEELEQPEVQVSRL